MIFITIFSIHFAFKQYNNINALNQAIIFTPTVTVKSSPDEKGADKFVIHEGTKVILLDELNNWVKISIANGSNGWVEKQCFEII
jgi:SH3-like domain-containing protein